jgi:hypothetical protein
MISEALDKFISVGLHVDGAAPDPPVLRSSMRSGSTAQAEVEAGLLELLSTRELTTLDWLNMTGVEFDSEDHLYDYVQKVYDYVFRGSEELPEIPKD